MIAACLSYSYFPFIFSFINVSAFINRFTVDVPKVRHLCRVNVTDTTIGIKWTLLNQTGIMGYRITVVAAGESLPILEDSVDCSTRYYTVRGLEPGIHYHISVTAMTEESEGQPTTITQETQTGESSSVCLEVEGEALNPRVYEVIKLIMNLYYKLNEAMSILHIMAV